MTTFSISITLILVFLLVFPSLSILFSIIERKIRRRKKEKNCFCLSNMNAGNFYFLLDFLQMMRGWGKMEGKRHSYLRRVGECKYMKEHMEGPRLFTHKRNQKDFSCSGGGRVMFCKGKGKMSVREIFHSFKKLKKNS
jgi:hypothetical protein